MTRKHRFSCWLSSGFDLAMRFRSPVKVVLHLAILVFAYLLAFLVRFDFEIPPPYLGVIGHTLPVLLAAKAAGFSAFGLFRGWWRYVSIKDVLPVLCGCATGTVLFGAAVYSFWGPWHVPRSVLLIDWGATVLFVLGARYLIRSAREAFGRGRREAVRKVLVVGAGGAGQMIAREIRGNVRLGMACVGFVDDDPQKVGTRIEGLKVLGARGQIDRICRRHAVDEIVIAIPSAPPRAVRHIVEHCRETAARLRILPGVGELIEGTVSVSALRNVDIADLLGRDPVALDIDLLRRHHKGRTVMITGAAGSIGSELCRQVARLSPASIVMYEIAESALFELEREMREQFPGLEVIPVIGDVRDRRRVEATLALHRPGVIYHAAAYKHVPVMEVHPVEAVKNNVLGTRVVAEAAARQGVERFVLVSTDKAVRPANIMGATKRVAELVILNMNGRGGKTRYVAVRFGNVLGSVGSVLPILRRQLETTGTLTVTHPEASRYFMLVEEAAGLILQAEAMGEGGEVFVLDMGMPVRIADLARNLIALSGREIGVDAEISYTGLRPGEKLREELVVEGEDVARTSHPKIMVMIGEPPVARAFHEEVDRLIDCAADGDRAGVVIQLKAIVKGYNPDWDFHGLGGPADEAAPGTAEERPQPPVTFH